jgi:hypothetical protein
LAEVHIDQSHCNFHLRRALVANGWDLLFRDAPSASRGGPGAQGTVLQIVESRGWPIPDLLLVRDDDLLVVEIDAQFEAAADSFARYLAVERELLRACSSTAGRPLRRLLLAFCRSALTVRPADYFQAEGARPVDVLVAFHEPGTPIFSVPFV